MRPLRPPSTPRAVTRVGGRARNLERRYIDVGSILTGSFRERVLAEATLEAYWPLNDESGDAHDEGPNNLPMADVGTPTYGVPGPFVLQDDTSILFDGIEIGFGVDTDDHFEVGHAFFSGAAYTIELMVYPVSTSAQTHAIVWAYTDATHEVAIQMTGDLKPIFVHGDPSTNFVAPGLALPLDAWTHVAVTYAAGVLKMYFNGVLVGSGFGATAAPATYKIGGMTSGGISCRYFNGRLAQNAIYSSALSPETLAEHASAGFATTVNGLEDDHGALRGLGDDDHPQYHNDTRGDARYPLKSLVTTAGDLLVATASAVLARLGIGSDGQVLEVDTSLTPKMKWATRIRSLAKAGSTALTGDVTLTAGANTTLTQTGNNITIAATVTGGGAVDSIAKSGDTPLTGNVTLSGGTGIALTQTGQDIAVAATGLAVMTLLYEYEVAGSAKASIDTNSDGAMAGALAAGDVLEVFILARNDNAAAVTGFDITVNNDTGANYDRQVLQGGNATASAAAVLAQTKWAVNCHAAGGSASYPSAVRITIPKYAGTTFNKVGEIFDSTLDATAGNNSAVILAVGWRSTAAINRMKIAAQGSNLFAIGTWIQVYKRG